MAKCSRRGFTLLELLLALGLSVLVMSIIVGLVGMYSSNFTTRGEDIRRVALARAILNMIADDLRSTVTKQEYDTKVLEQMLVGQGGGAAAGGVQYATSSSATGPGLVSGGQNNGGRNNNGQNGGGQNGGGQNNGQNGGGQNNGRGNGQGGGNNAQNNAGQSAGGQSPGGNNQNSRANASQGNSQRGSQQTQGNQNNRGGAQMGGAMIGGMGQSSGQSTGQSGQSQSGSQSGQNGQSDSSAASADGSTVTATTSLPLGVYGSTTNLTIDVSRIPRLDEYNSQQNSLLTGTLSDLPGDIKSVTYYVQQPTTVGVTDSMNQVSSTQTSTNGAAGLVRRALDRAVMDNAEATGQSNQLTRTGELVAPEVLALEFSYYDGTQWTTTWDSSTQGLPWLVDISLAMQSKSGEKNGAIPPGISLSTMPYEERTRYGIEIYNLMVTIPGAQLQSTSSTATDSSGTGASADSGLSSVGL